MLIQQGARRNYIYARQLEAAGLLQSVVTDAAWPQTGPGLVRRCVLRVMPRLARLIERRTIQGVPPQRVRASVLPNVAALARRVMHEERAYRISDEALALVNLPVQRTG